MYPIKSKCTIYDRSFVDDLRPYDITDDPGNFNLRYSIEKGFASTPIVIRQSPSAGDLLRYITNYSPTLEDTYDVWRPIIFKENMSNWSQMTREIINQEAIITPRLGIEDYITFKPSFKSWEIIQESNSTLIPNPAMMSIDFMISPVTTSSIPVYGIMGWFKDSDKSPSFTDFNLEFFPNGSRLIYRGPIIIHPTIPTQTLITDKEYIKLSNSKVLLIQDANNRSKFTTGKIEFKQDRAIDIDTLISVVKELKKTSIKFCLSTDKLDGIESNSSTSNIQRRHWISNGDHYSYFLGPLDRDQSYDNDTISRSYISPCLYHKYRNIYNILYSSTVESCRFLNSLAITRRLHKISQALATSPLTDGVTSRLLLDRRIINYVTNFLKLGTDVAAASEITNKAPKYTYVEEADSLYILMTNIFRRLRDMELTNGVNLSSAFTSQLSHKTLSNNYIYNKTTLFQKLLSKYGASLRIKDKEVKLVFKEILDQNSIFINQPIRNLCDRTSKGTSNQAWYNFYNNQSIQLGSTLVATSIKPTTVGLNQGGNQVIFDGYSLINVRDTGKKGIVIPLLDVYKDVTNKFSISAGSDIVVNLADSQPIKNFAIDRVGTITSIVNPDASYLWEKISGPCARFTDYNRDIYRQIRFSQSTEHDPEVYIYEIGRYEFRLTVSTKFITLTDTKVVWVVDDNNYYELRQAGTYYKAPASMGADKDLLVPTPARFARNISYDPLYLKIMCPNLAQVAITDGLFWPIKTDCSIGIAGKIGSTDNQIFPSANLGGNYRFKFDKSSNPIFSPAYLTLGYFPGNTTMKLDFIVLENMRSNKPKCSQCLSFHDNLLISDKLSYIRKLGSSDSISLLSLPATLRPITITTYQYPDITTDPKFAPPIKSYGGYSREIVESLFEGKTVFLGQGVDPFSLKHVGGNDAPYSNFGQPITPLIGYNLPSITGHNLREEIDYAVNVPDQPIKEDGSNKYKICHMVPSRGHALKDYHHSFTKGCFHPSSGWLDTAIPEFSKLNNKSSVLKFSPGHRDTFRLVGAGFNTLKSLEYVDKKSFPQFRYKPGDETSNGNEDKTPKITYKSTISLNIDNRVALPEPIKGEKAEAYIARSQPRELSDHDVNHGYRFLNEGIRNNYNDEYNVTTNMDNKTSVDCDNNTIISYTFPVRGKTFVPEDNKGAGILQDADLEARTIEDIEIKLNFLNYINTQDLIIWLDVDVCAAEAARINQEGNPDPMRAERKGFRNEHLTDGGMGSTLKEHEFFTNTFLEGIGDDTSPKTYFKEYLKGLIDINTPGKIERHLLYDWKNDLANKEVKTKFRLVLLNQEYVQNNGYNFNLLFSDHASKNTVPSNDNTTTLNKIFAKNTNAAIRCREGSITKEMGVDIVSHSRQSVDSICLLPSKKGLTALSENENLSHAQAMTNSNIPMKYASFAKFRDLKLFGAQGTGTRFTLNIAVVGQSIDMSAQDNIKDNDLLSGLKSTKVKKESDSINNSLCSWELILHTKPIKGFIDKDSLGLIKYGSEPNIPGYNFKCDFKDSKYLIPPVNINAPNTYSNDMSICIMNSSIDGTNNILHKTPSNSTRDALKLVLIISNSFIGIFLASMGIGSTSQAFQPLFDFFKNKKIAESVDNSNSMVDKADYNTFGFGSGEKVLINVRKRNEDVANFGDINDLLWYTMEATIFKYKNTKILKNNRYSMIKNRYHIFSIYKIEDYDTSRNSGDVVVYIEGKRLKFILDTPSMIIADNDLNLIQTIHKAGGQVTKDMLTNEQLDYLSKEGILLGENTIISIDTANIEQYRPEMIFNYIRYQPGRGAQVITKDKKLFTNINKPATVLKLPKSWSILKLTLTDKAEVRSVELSKRATRVVVPNMNTIILFRSAIDIENPDEGTCAPMGLEKGGTNNKIPEILHSAFGEGAYGNGSPFIDPSILSSIPRYNRLDNIYEIFNNHENDRLKYLDMSYYDIRNGSKASKETKGYVKGYPWSLSDNPEIFLTENNYNLFIDKYKKIYTRSETDISKSLLEIKETLSKISNIQKSNYTYIDLVFEDNDIEQFNSIGFTDISEFRPLSIKPYIVSIAGDYIEHIPIKRGEALLDDTQELEAREKNILYLRSRLDYINKTISDLKNQYNLLPPDPIECYAKIIDGSKENRDLFGGQKPLPVCQQRDIKKRLLAEYRNKNDVLSIYEREVTRKVDDKNGIETILKKEKALPYLEPKALNSTEYNSLNDDVYWINIDPKQGCSLAYEELPKILKKIIYKCNGVVGFEIDPDAINICPRRVDSAVRENSDATFINNGDKFEYTIDDTKIDDWKNYYQQKYKIKFDQWQEFIVSKKFFINTNGPRDTLVEATEYYDILKEPESKYSIGGGTLVNKDGSRIDNRVYNKFNLNDISNIDVKFKIIPRKIKHIDNHYTRNIITSIGSTIKGIAGVGNSGGRIYNEMEQWICYDPRSMKVTATTDYLKVQNEMIFRSYFSSVDGIEHKYPLFDSVEPWEMIPYEYKLE